MPKIKGWKRLQSYEKGITLCYWEREHYAEALEVRRHPNGYIVILHEAPGYGEFYDFHRIGKYEFDTQEEAYQTAIKWMKNKSW